MKSVRNAFAVVVAVIALAACGASGKAVVEQFYTNVDKGEISAAIQALSPTTRGMMPDAKIRAMMSEQSRVMQKKGGIKAIQVEGTEKGETGQYIVRLTFGDGSQQQETVKVAKVDGKWYIEK